MNIEVEDYEKISCFYAYDGDGILTDRMQRFG